MKRSGLLSYVSNFIDKYKFKWGLGTKKRKKPC